MKITADQLIGFCACPIVNLVLWIITQRNDSWALPWIGNVIVLALAFFLRPDFGVGYVAFICLTFTLLTVAAVCIVAACFVPTLL